MIKWKKLENWPYQNKILSVLFVPKEATRWTVHFAKLLEKRKDKKDLSLGTAGRRKGGAAEKVAKGQLLSWRVSRPQRRRGKVQWWEGTPKVQRTRWCDGNWPSPHFAILSIWFASCFEDNRCKNINCTWNTRDVRRGLFSRATLAQQAGARDVLSLKSLRDFLENGDRKRVFHGIRVIFIVEASRERLVCLHRIVALFVNFEKTGRKYCLWKVIKKKHRIIIKCSFISYFSICCLSLYPILYFSI